MLLAGILVTATMGLAIVTAREIEALKQRLARLQETRAEAQQRLEEAKDYRASISGTRDMLKALLTNKAEQKTKSLDYLEQLKEEVVEERDIGVSNPLQAPRDESGGPAD